MLRRTLVSQLTWKQVNESSTPTDRLRPGEPVSCKRPESKVKLTEVPRASALDL